MKKIVIIIDSFKGCLTSMEAGKAAEAGVNAVFPKCETIVLPISDGGEGMQEVLIDATRGQRIPIRAHDPLMELHDTYYGISGDGLTAFIEMASINGLPLVALEKRNPMTTTTYGTGELIKDALERGCRKFIIGLGGSATNDAGLGMLQALGFRFYNKNGMELGKILPLCGALLSEVFMIDSSSALTSLSNSNFTVACDVRNPFYGPNGAAFAFASQKGADKSMVCTLDASMQQLAKVIDRETGKDISQIPGAGAAGGMGGGLFAFLNADLKPGIQLLLEVLQFPAIIRDADFIITGEGKADKQTLMGKVPFGILNEARKQKIPVILLSGSIEDRHQLNQAGFSGVFSITPSPISLEQAMEPIYAQENLKQTVVQICRIMKYL